MPEHDALLRHVEGPGSTLLPEEPPSPTPLQPPECETPLAEEQPSEPLWWPPPLQERLGQPLMR